jgi:hypothetical protein
MMNSVTSFFPLVSVDDQVRVLKTIPQSTQGGNSPRPDRIGEGAGENPMLNVIFVAYISHDHGRDRHAVFLYNDGDAIFSGPSNIFDDAPVGDSIHNVADRGICRPLSAPDRGEYEH